MEQSEENREEVQEMDMKELNEIVSKNKMNLFGKDYPLFTTKDILDKDLGGCIYCLLHNDHTPCGQQLLKWKECTLKNQERKEKGLKFSDEQCNQLFQDEFFPCFARYAQTEYFKLRADFVIQSKTKDLMKLHFKIQKKQLRDKIKLDLI